MMLLRTSFNAMVSIPSDRPSLHPKFLSQPSISHTMSSDLAKDLKNLESDKRKEVKLIKSRTAKKLQKAELDALDEKYTKLEEELKAKYSTKNSSDGRNNIEEVEAKNTTEEQQDIAQSMQGMSLYNDDDKGKQKKSKSQRKKEKQQAKERARELEIEEELANAGPSQRDIEVASLKEKFLDPAGLMLKEVMADGHCLYRAVSDQVADSQSNYSSVRAICADTLMNNADEYAPFAEFDDSFEGYVDAVRNSAQWGGQLEVRALAQALKRTIIVYSVEYSEPLVMGEEFSSHSDSNPIRLSFHRHYYALGEHYNSVVTK